VGQFWSIVNSKKQKTSQQAGFQFVITPE